MTDNTSIDLIIEEISNEFWNIDCLIRLTKELILNNNFNKLEIQEEDIYVVCNLLSNSTKKLSKKITELTTNIKGG